MATRKPFVAWLKKTKVTAMTEHTTLAQSILRNAFGLALFAMVTAGIIALVQHNTQHRIVDNIAQAQARALYEITPQDTLDNDLLADKLDLTAPHLRARINLNALGKLPSGASAHFAKKDGVVHTIIFPVISPNGYTTDIRMLVGVKLDGTLAGVRVVEHKETPGLGDKIEIKKSNWIDGFSGKSLQQPEKERWKVQKDGGHFDQFTGATITPRAVVGAVYQTLAFFHKNHSLLLKEFAQQGQLSARRARHEHPTAQ